MIIFYLADKYEKEPLHMLFRCLILGAAIIIPLSIIQTFVPWIYTVKFESEIISNLYRIAVLAPLFEESFKFLVIMLFVVRSKHFNEPFDGIVYYVAVAVGFAIIEDWGYIAGYSMSSFFEGMKTGDMAQFFSASFKITGIRAWPAHALFGAISGYLISVGRFIKRKQTVKYYVLALLVGMVCHSIWNTICVASRLYKINSALPLALYVVILLTIVIITGKKLLKASPFNKPVKEMFPQDFKALLASKTYSKKNLIKFFGYLISTAFVILLIEVISSLIFMVRHYKTFFGDL